MSNQDDRVALVTGASRGIGRAIARRLASDGVALAINDLPRQEEACVALEHELRQGGAKAITALGDVGSKEDVSRVTERTVAQLGSIDILVNNAAVFPWTSWTEISDVEWDQVLRVNLKGAFLCAQTCFPFMKVRKWGRIISMTSATALTGDANLIHYSASKAAIIGLTRSLARAVGDYGITANAVSTGKTLTEGFREWFDQGVLDYEDVMASRQNQCIKRVTDPSDIAAAVSFLASDDAGFITGQVINVDGGRNMY